MRKTAVTLERVTGIVALTYLVLIPAGAFYAWQHIKRIDADVTVLWEGSGMGAVHPERSSRLRDMKKAVFG